MSKMPNGLPGLIAAVVVDGTMLIRDVWTSGTQENREGFVARARTLVENVDRIASDIEDEDRAKRRSGF